MCVCDPHLSAQLTVEPPNDCYYPSYCSLTAQWVAAEKQRQKVKREAVIATARGPSQGIPTSSLGHSHTSPHRQRLVFEVAWGSRRFNLKSGQMPENEAIIKTVLMRGGLFLTPNRPHTCLSNMCAFKVKPLTCMLYFVVRDKLSFRLSLRSSGSQRAISVLGCDYVKV